MKKLFLRLCREMNKKTEVNELVNEDFRRNFGDASKQKCHFATEPLNLIRNILITIRNLDDCLTNLTSNFFPRRYLILGECKKCGICCKNIAIYLSSGFWNSRLLLTIIIRWFTFVYNFEFLNKEEAIKVLVFKCNYQKNGQCSIYKKRPYICRNYPRPRYFDKPSFFPSCGFNTKISS